ncbi:YbhB/YbcL family Raf kinase inhibitor-like protein [Symbioplanes lichenis]|uniref:YbhB/YbcL family Raf kinase inhibitor-like protein n=1 Tax=Symbioplanes lichenis TaxID=1629072 RepID=UPI00273A33E6|nr:YbhB/YbcL family Raf kinase inhibitor-like protein [Actinoplanes lichenis]
MALLGKLLKNRRAGEAGLAWHAPHLAGPETLTVTSPDFGHEETLPVVHAGRKLGGEDASPALAWTAAPEGTAQLLLVVEDPDAPTPKPFNHGVFLLEPGLTSLDRGALDGERPATGVRPLQSGKGRGYLGPAPIKSHGPHRYAFQLFALGEPLAADVEAAKPAAVVAAAGPVLARGRIDGFYDNP